jgi:hypothetical protein
MAVGMVEAYHMVAEEVTKGIHSTSQLMSGALFDSVVSNYLGIVQANVQHLSARFSPVR